MHSVVKNMFISHVHVLEICAWTSHLRPQFKTSQSLMHEIGGISTTGMCITEHLASALNKSIYN